MMKKAMSLVLASAMLLSLVACGGETTKKEDSTDANKTTQEAVQTPVSEEDTEEVVEAEKEIAFTEIVAVDNENCNIKLTGIEEGTMWGYTIKAVLENKSADKTYMFAVEDASINGVQSEPAFATEIAPGKKANGDISFVAEELNKHGIEEFTDIEMTFRVYDYNDWEAEPVALETVHIYPYGEDKAVKFVREAKESDQVLVDNEQVSCIVTGYEKDGPWGYTVNLFLLNKTDKSVMFSADEASVNGFMVDPFYAASVAPGKCAFSIMAWDNASLEENGITDVEDIEFKLRIYHDEDWTGEDLVSEVITLNP